MSGIGLSFDEVGSLPCSRRRFAGGLAGASVLAAVPGAAAFAQAADASTTIFHGGTILTMNRAMPSAQAVAIRGERILAVGSLADVTAQAGSGARKVNLDGRTLMPGLIDAHMHAQSVLYEDWIDVGVMSTPDFAGVERKIREAIAKTPPGEWVIAQLYDPTITKDAVSPSLAMMDAWAPNHPLFILEGNGHVGYANSRALAAAGITRETPDPPLARYGRDASGNLTGRMEESAAMLPLAAKIPKPSPRELVARIGRMFEHASAVGCTGLHDAGIGTLAGPADLELINSAMAANPPVRYRGMLVSTHMDAWEKAGMKPGKGDDLFRIDGIKCWSDGSNQGFTGYQRENYLGKDNRGALNYTLEQLTDAVRRAHAGGWQVGVHANGDAAIDTTLQAYEAVLREAPRKDHRHRIEHCSVLHPEHIAKMKELGLSPSFLIGHVRWWGKAFRDRILGPDRAHFYDPCASALKAGLRISLHSDWNVTPLEPLRYVEDAAARVMNEGGDVLFPDERIPVEAALRAVTLDAAWQCRMDDITGSIEPGKYADMAILEANPIATDPTKISEIKVNETWMNGQRRHAG